ncbi:MAG: c-type cytochrome [Rhodocyclaceae bacterium]|nr:c-type cytochrome [Rhodocyclaceae bacterium]
MKKVKLGLAVALALAGTACSNLERSRDLANPNVPPAVTAMQVCSICHGVTGNPVSPIFPRLAGQQRDYLVAQLEQFRSHHRADPAGFEYMFGLSRNLTDAQIQGLADYFTKQVPLPGAPGDPALMAAGKEIFEKGVPEKATPPCVACHGPKGEGVATFPRLAYQYADYLSKQMHVFRETEGRPNTPMTQVAHGLSSTQVEAVAAYLQAFPTQK